ncbi:multiple C2 domain and transmembrane region protein 16 [Malania oleifera]|uniref:multiple C2 domain and transmembrane region protein 16 n=1 Tax=Malania oleifera TaxID=397392 RepID=UPI0025AD9FDF|nr:multiple C2 domain and transmembrane region protein 16 [Malania oleifera]
MASIRKLIVEVVDARDLLPKDGRGTASPFVMVDFHGQRKKTSTAIRTLNPTWNEVLDFKVVHPSHVFGDELEVALYHDKIVGPTTRNNFLGKVVVHSRHFVTSGEEAVVRYPLESKSWLSWVRGDIGLKIYYHDEVVPPPPPPPPPPSEEPTTKSETPPPPSAVPEEATPGSDTPPKEATEHASAEKSDSAAGPPPEPGKSPSNPPEPPKSNEEPPVPPPSEASATTPPALENDGTPVQVYNPPPPPPPQPAEPSANFVDPSPSQPDAETEAASKVVLPPEIMAATVSKSVPQVQLAGISPPPPIPRPIPARHYATDPPEKIPIDRCSFDLVDKMHYLFVRIVKARSLPTTGFPVVKISVSGSHVTSKPARKTAFFKWDQTFAFGRATPDSTSANELEVSVWDPPAPDVEPTPEMAGYNFLGGLCFDTSEILLRDPPDSPLAAQWYRLELEEGGAHNGDLMLATWVGTQADEAFPDAWKTDTAGNVSSRSKIYLSPKLWYLRATVIEAQDILPLTAVKEMSFQVKAQLGFQVMKTKFSLTTTSSGSLSWNEDLMFVASEPLCDDLVLILENRQPKGPVICGVAKIPLAAIERRVDDRQVAPKWYSFEDRNEETRVYRGRIHLRLCFDGGYHVMDEAAHVCSDYRPTARQLWKPPIGTVELGIVGCKNLLPMKTVNGKGSTHAYSVAKYGPKWVRTRTVSDSLEPKWNEQYTWKVYDPCTVLTVGVFDSWGVFEMDGSKEATRPDFRIGKVRIRISTLQTGRIYRNTYPLLLLTPTGLRKLGEIELAVRFIRATPTLDVLHVYSQPQLPLMHHIKPLGMVHQEMLRNTAVKIVAAHLSRSEPPLRREIVLYMLDADSHTFSMRKVRANWYRIINVVAGVIDVVGWVENTRTWKNPTGTVLVHALLVMLVWFPDLIVPTLAFYVFVIGAWNYRFRSRDPPPHFCAKLSMTEMVDREELDEEFDAVPSSRSPEVVRARYDKLRTLGARVQTVLGDLATQGERVQALVTWRDPRATGIFVGLCFVVALILYLVPSKMVAMASGFYYLRHPMFRDRMPSPALNFFRRLPSLSDRIM